MVGHLSERDSVQNLLDSIGGENLMAQPLLSAVLAEYPDPPPSEKIVGFINPTGREDVVTANPDESLVVRGYNALTELCGPVQSLDCKGHFGNSASNTADVASLISDVVLNKEAPNQETREVKDAVVSETDRAPLPAPAPKPPGPGGIFG